jgi:hypothetical protein
MSAITKGLKLGKAQPVWKCPREIRLWSGQKLGEISECWNEQLNRHERYICIKVAKNYNDSIMQLIID